MHPTDTSVFNSDREREVSGAPPEKLEREDELELFI